MSSSSPPPLIDRNNRVALIVRHSDQALSVDDNYLLRQSPLTFGARQEFILVPSNDLRNPNYFHIIHAASNRLVQVENSSHENGVSITTYPPNGGLHQLFRFQPVKGGFVIIQAKHSGKVLDVDGASLDDNARIHQWHNHGGPNQQFAVRPVPVAQPPAPAPAPVPVPVPSQISSPVPFYPQSSLIPMAAPSPLSSVTLPVSPTVIYVQPTATPFQMNFAGPTCIHILGPGSVTISSPSPSSLPSSVVGDVASPVGTFVSSSLLTNTNDPAPPYTPPTQIQSAPARLAPAPSALASLPMKIKEGSLVNVSVGYDGSIWGVNSSDNIYYLSSPSGSWQQVPGSLIQISVGPGGIVAGCNRANDIYVCTSPSGNWRQIDGKLKCVSVGPMGSLWGVNSNDDIYYRASYESGSWTHIDGKLKQIDVGIDGYVAGVNSNDDIYVRDGSSGGWTNIPGKLRWVEVGLNRQLWGTNSSFTTFHYYDNSWHAKPTISPFMQLSVGTNSNNTPLLAGVDAKSRIYIGNPESLL